jgi:hypothetical protein
MDGSPNRQNGLSVQYGTTFREVPPTLKALDIK